MVMLELATYYIGLHLEVLPRFKWTNNKAKGLLQNKAKGLTSYCRSTEPIG